MFVRTGLVRIITFGFADAITLFPFIFIRPDATLSRRLVVHERIHLAQQTELLVVPFYLIYFLEYLIRLLTYGNHFRAYRNISFEREAYANECEGQFVAHRPVWNWVKYIRQS